MKLTEKKDANVFFFTQLIEMKALHKRQGPCKGSIKKH